MSDLTADQIRAFALTGARTELSRIFATFPELRAEYRLAMPGSSPDVHLNTGSSNGDTPPKRKRQGQMSEQQRKAVSKRMRKYWAQRRADAAAK